MSEMLAIDITNINQLVKCVHADNLLYSSVCRATGPIQYGPLGFDRLQFHSPTFVLQHTGGSVFRGVPGLTSRTQQDPGQMSSAFELQLTYVQIDLGFRGNPLVATFEGFARRGST